MFVWGVAYKFPISEQNNLGTVPLVLKSVLGGASTGSGQVFVFKRPTYF